MLQRCAIICSAKCAVKMKELKVNFMYFTVEDNRQENATLCFLVAIFLRVIVFFKMDTFLLQEQCVL